MAQKAPKGLKEPRFLGVAPAPVNPPGGLKIIEGLPQGRPEQRQKSHLHVNIIRSFSLCSPKYQNPNDFPCVSALWEQRMGKDERAEAYLAKAKAAEEEAEKATDPVAKSTWERIAKGYRDLARMPGCW